MRHFKLAAITAAISLPLLAGCVTPGEDDANAMTKQGAAGGALLGLTLGALTGEPELAVKGAIAGGVTGGVAGASADVQNNRDNIRHDSRNESLSQIGNGGQSSSTPEQWDELNTFVGDWRVSIQNHGEHAPDIGALSASGSLAKTTQAEVNVNNEAGVDLTAQFSYSATQGYELVVTNHAKEVDVNFAGDFQASSNHYNFYPTDINEVIYQGIDTADTRVELNFAGPQVWTLTTFAFIEGKDQPIQSFRFTRI